MTAVPSSTFRFVPVFKQPHARFIRDFVRELGDVDRLVVLTGAGISTESGIPDYRSEGVGQYARSNHKVLTHQEFLASEKNRKRYWARNFLAWPYFRDAQPNETHKAIAKWERSDRFGWLITQNVDGLHTRAGTTLQTELHGSGRRVRCMGCGEPMSRQDLQDLLGQLNPRWVSDESPGEIMADGDVKIREGAENDFVKGEAMFNWVRNPALVVLIVHVPPCQSCGVGILKTDVVFFGDNVPRRDVDLCYEKVNEADGILVLGSSLMVMSGYRFVYHASLKKKPIFIVNIGPTRADELASMRLHCPASMVVPLI